MRLKTVVVRWGHGIRRALRRVMPRRAPPPPSQSSASHTAPLTPRDVLSAEGYRFLRPIGEGGYGTVWMVDGRGKDLRALKIVELREGHEDGFERERAAMERVQRLSLTSQFLVPIDEFQVREEHGFLAYSMPMADDFSGHPITDRDGYTGRTLETELKRRGRLPVDECVAITRRVLGAVKVLHARGLIHRDIKLTNVLYLQGRAVLADYGLVTHESRDASQFCSPSNKPPEGVGVKAGDLYAVAVLLYRLATNSKPDNFPAVNNDSNDARFTKLVRVFTMAGEDEPHNRYINARAMELALDWVMEDASQTKPAKLPQKTWLTRWRERRRVKPPDPAGMVRFKEHIRHIVECGKLEAAARSNPQRDFMDQDDFGAVVGHICHAFERRIGREPPLVKAAGLMAQAAMEPKKTKREELVKKAAAVTGGATGIGMVITSMGLALGLGQGAIHGLIAFFVGSAVGGPVALGVAGATLAAVAGWLLLGKDDPKARAERATKALLEGLDAAIDEAWGKYGDQLSL